jgi:hypothetical protein
MQRREFTGAITATAAAGTLPPGAEEPKNRPDAPPEPPKETRRGDMLYRQLGTTKEQVSLIGLGGHHIGRQKDEKDSIAIYQAYSPAIAEAALSAGRFVPPFSFHRMTWIKPSFLWLMHRSNWGQKCGQERVLAVRMTRVGWDITSAGNKLTRYAAIAESITCLAGARCGLEDGRRVRLGCRWTTTRSEESCEPEPSSTHHLGGGAGRVIWHSCNRSHPGE